MARIQYKLFQVDPVGLEQLSEFDLKNVSSFQINSRFQAFENKVELHVYTEEDVLIESFYDHRAFRFLQGSETVKTEGASELTIDPIEDAITLNYDLGGVKFVYNFLDNLYSSKQSGGEFFIQEISEDRTELRLLTNQLNEEDIVDGTNAIIEDLNSDSYFNDFRLNLKNNDLLIGINISIQDYRDFKSVIVKLYEPLPILYQVKDLLTIERVVSDSIAYRIDTTITPDEVKIPTLKGPNFNIEEPDSLSYPTSFLSTNDLFSFPTNNTYRQVNSLLKEKGIELSINYNDYNNFVLFSSAEERLRNFKYKLDLIEDYQKNADSASAAIAAGNTRFLSGSEKYWKDKIDSITQNFDHYDRHLYYESGSTSWPKQQPQDKPYLNATGSATSSFYNNQLLSASGFDLSNNSSLTNSIPEYLREDPNSTKYSTFMHMLGQHFDNIWVYTKALSEKYDNDNRLNYGISKDLIQDTLRNFGVKIYNSLSSTEDLFKTFTGQLYHSSSHDFEQSGSNIIASLSGSIGLTIPVSASEGVIPLDSLENYKKQIYKRLYHNLPYLLKTKGTERGLKALIASFGIPTDNNIIGSGSNITGLQIRTIGGSNTTSSINFGPLVEYSSSLDKVRTDNTGSIISGSSTSASLSNFVSIIKRDSKYSDDNHTVEVGYSPTYPLNDYIKGQIGSSFNIDDYIGDPRQAYSSSYELLISESNRIIPTGSHHYGEFVRVLKFYDNVLFKMIKDFVPARSNIDTGIIIKPHLLERNKIKQVQGTFDKNLIYSGTIDTAFISGSQGGAFTHKYNKEFAIPLTASYTESYVAPDGVVQYDYHLKERTRYDGEFSGSYIEVYDHSLNDANTWKYGSPTNIQYNPALVELISCPVVTTHSPIVSTLLAITGSGSITHTSDVSGGFVYSSTNATPTISDSSTGNIFFGTGTYDQVITGLQTGSWYIRAFASSSGCGYTYGEVQTATISCPAVTAVPASSIGDNEFTASATYTDAGTGTFISKGFLLWTGSSTPRELDDTLLSKSIDTVDTGTGAYSFSFSGSNLATGTTHYFRAYVSSSVCTAYSLVKSFTTSTGYGVGSFAASTPEETPGDASSMFCAPMAIVTYGTTLYFERQSVGQALPNVGQVVYTDPDLLSKDYGLHYRVVDTAGSDNIILINGNGTIDSYTNCDSL